MIWVDIIVQGILFGGFYVLFVVGFSFVFGIMCLVNLVYGDLIVMVVYLIFILVMLLGLDFFLVVLIVVFIFFGIGWLLQMYVFNCMFGIDILLLFLVIFGLLIVI